MDFTFNTYVRKPFTVEALEITEENISQVAETFHIGDVKETEAGKPFILVDRRVVPNIYRVYPGFFMTRLGDHIRCYNRKVFFEQFTESSTEIMAWVDFMHNGGTENSRVHNVFDGEADDPTGLTKATPA